MKTLILYSTVGCHLCEQALEVMRPLVAADYQINEVDISESDELMERYGIRIPVVARQDNGHELGWPFDHQLFSAFLN